MGVRIKDNPASMIPILNLGTFLLTVSFVVASNFFKLSSQECGTNLFFVRSTVSSSRNDLLCKSS